MLILDPKSGQSVQVDPTAQHRLFLAALGSSGPGKVPANSREILASPVSFGLRAEYKTSRHSWASGNDEYNKNNPALRVHGDCLLHPWTRTWNGAAPEPRS
jgi:hypothetical protein